MDVLEEVGCRQSALLDDAFDAARKAGPIVVGEILGGHDDHRSRSHIDSRPELDEKIEPIHHRHHEIEKDDVGPALLDSFESFGAVGRLRHRPTVIVKRSSEELAGSTRRHPPRARARLHPGAAYWAAR